MRLFVVLLLSLSLWVAPKGLEAMSHTKKEIPVTFDICLSYAICSFKFTDDREVAKRMGFFHDMVVMRIGSLGNLSYVEECNSGISDFKSYIWQLVMQRMVQADKLVLVGEKFRSTLQGTLLIDDVDVKDLTLSILSDYNECKF